MIEIKGTYNTIKVFTDYLEDEAWRQLKELANTEAYNESVFRIMPDVHAGKGCTVGTTMTITDKITPNMVGVDIGCGMLVIELEKKVKYIDFNNLDKVINQYVPHGFNIHNKHQSEFNLDNLICKKTVNLSRAALSLGSLGGGNHFIEVGESDSAKYLIIHSGSRHLGNQVCQHYQNLAWSSINEMSQVKSNLIEKLKKEKREKDIQSEIKNIQKIGIPKHLAYLTDNNFKNYLHDMEIVQEFATANRNTIAKIICKEMKWYAQDIFHTVHNYIDIKNKILRKGAVSAQLHEVLIIPMNMKDGSLLCVGKGNSEWNNSAPHGAGRLMSRSKAKSSLNMKDFKNQMKNIHSTSVCIETLDEAPGAYKPMDEIINNIGDTVEIVSTIKTLYNFKSH